MDFAKFYNEQPDYAAFRNDDLKREEYNVTVDWKARKLCHLIPDGFVINSIMEVGCAIGILLNNISDPFQSKYGQALISQAKILKSQKGFSPAVISLQELLRIIPEFFMKNYRTKGLIL